MTKRGRVINFIRGILVIAMAFVLALAGADGIRFILFFLGFGFFLRGTHSFLYYVSMARFMVGGKRSLFHAILFLDLWVFTSSVALTGDLMGIVYVAFLDLFAGVVKILRTREEMKSGARHWRFSMTQGVVNMLLAVIALAGGVVMGKVVFAVYVYALGLAWSGISRIIASFRRTAIVYIQ